jgi:hypothetical protein
MSQTDQFWQYAKEAMLSGFRSAMPKPTMTSRRCLILRGPGRKRHY